MLTELDKRMNVAEYALRSMRYYKRDIYRDVKLLFDNDKVARVIDSAGNVFEFECVNIHGALIGKKIDVEKIDIKKNGLLF